MLKKYIGLWKKVYHSRQSSTKEIYEYYFSNKWEKMGDELKFDLSRGTLLYGEVVKEMRGEARSQRKVIFL